MIAALLIGRKGSRGFPDKNVYPVLGHPLAYYPLVAAKKAELVDEVFISTDSPELMKLAEEQKVNIIERPAELCTNQALGEDVFVHGYKQITKLKGPLELIVLLHCNSASANSDLIDQGIRVLRDHSSYDSAVSVSIYNMWSPLRARKIGEDGLLHPFVSFRAFGDPLKLNCDRDSQGDVYFADMSISVVRPRCLENIEHGLLPQRWMGQKIYPLVQEAGCDIDFEYQVPQTEYWLKKYWKHNNLKVLK